MKYSKYGIYSLVKGEVEYMKFGNFKMPTGGTGSVTSINDWLQYILGAFMLVATFGLGTKLFNFANAKTPKLDASVQSVTAKQAANGKYNY